jgi:hypothetical protein
MTAGRWIAPRDGGYHGAHLDGPHGAPPKTPATAAGIRAARERPSEEYRAGARREAELTVKGMTSSGRELYDYVRIVAQQGRNGPDIAEEVAMVFTAARFRHRRRLAWRLLRGR